MSFEQLSPAIYQGAPETLSFVAVEDLRPGDRVLLHLIRMEVLWTDRKGKKSELDGYLTLYPFRPAGATVYVGQIQEISFYHPAFWGIRVDLAAALPFLVRSGSRALRLKSDGCQCLRCVTRFN